MQMISKPILSFVFASLYVMSLNAQQKKTELMAGQFVGSTPCDAFIRSSLHIPQQDSCEFIKWDLRLRPGEVKNEFDLAILYGVGKPNTNGFEGGGKQVKFSGKLGWRTGSPYHAPRNLVTLNALQPVARIFLVEMSSDVFHFCDEEGRLLVGNGGWGYVLNRSID
jgi:hypothetical protein